MNNLPSINELISELVTDSKVFFIPSYQRGYRWETEQVEDLLNDIESFVSRVKGKDEIYCLQPLIVKSCEREIEKNGETVKTEVYDVVDGQQRLTTIFLIIKTLFPDTQLYDIHYETRQDSSDFLAKSLDEMKVKEKDNKPLYEKNIDYYHIYIVKDFVNNWKKGKNLDEFKKVLFEKVRFIWYPIENKEKPEDVFKRINIGKIPLTDAELIKGLFLNVYNYQNHDNCEVKNKINYNNYIIASEWDKIEYALQNDEFWLFVQNDHTDEGPNKMPTRIEYFLDIIAEQGYFDLTINVDDSDNHKTYRYFNEAFERCKKDPTSSENWVLELWTEVRKIYQIVNEWYHDPEIFHYVGYMITVTEGNGVIKKYIDKWIKTNKNDFIIHIKKDIKKHIRTKNKSWIDRIDDAVFEVPDPNNSNRTTVKGDCKDLLLLHNIETVVRQNKYLENNKKYNLPNFTKFAFHLYKRDDWQVEHISPNAGDTFVEKVNEKEKPIKEHIRIYLEYAKKSYSSDDSLIKDIDFYIGNYLNNEQIDDEVIIEKFQDIRETIIKNDGGIGDEDKNKIYNYTLLDGKTNAGYGNYIFQVKRIYLFRKEQGEKISPTKIRFGEDAHGEESTVPFVPPCTKNIFTKYYTRLPNTLVMWSKEDAKAYLENMKELLADFITK